MMYMLTLLANLRKNNFLKAYDQDIESSLIKMIQKLPSSKSVKF